MNLLKSHLRLILLMVLAMNLAGAARPLSAQDQVAVPSKQKPDDSPKHRGFAGQLTHETREAAGEEEKDDKAQFRDSPAVRFIARATGLSTGNAYLLSVLLNFAVIAGLILWVSRKYLTGAFSARTAAIQKAMQEAQKASEEARRRLAEIENRLKKLDVEIGMMRDSAEKETAAEEARIQAAAHEDARKMVESVRHEMASAAKAARRELTAYAADLAIRLAKKQIRVDAGTDEALVKNFAANLGAYSDSTVSGASESGARRKDGR